MTAPKQNFYQYIFSKNNRGYLAIGLLVGILYFIALRLLFPVPSFFSDSYTYVGAAARNQPVSFRPLGYSKVMNFFRLFTLSDFALIAGQYFSNLLANLLLFFTCTYFFIYKTPYKNLLFALLVVNPFYLFYSNYISPDAFFNGFTVVWLCLLVWMMYAPRWYYALMQLSVLVFLFTLRYHAVIFPVILIIALCLSKQQMWRKLTVAVVSIGAILLIVIYTNIQTKKYTGTKTFSAFSGWQMANNALTILHYEKIDSSKITDPQVKNVLSYTVNYFDTTKQKFKIKEASAEYLWHVNSPLKRYMKVYAPNKIYFRTWNELGPIYNRFGKTVILQKPFSYIAHFALPNTKAYFLPKTEIYETYMEGIDTIAKVAQNYFHYKSNKAPQNHSWVYSTVFRPWTYIFPVVNLLFIILTVFFAARKKYKTETTLFNNTLLVSASLFIVNFFFIVFLAPTVLRYHIFILTLSYPIILYLIQKPALQNSNSVANIIN